MVRRPSSPPSEFSKYSVWHGAYTEACRLGSGFLVPFLDYRDCGSEPPMPITLVDPALARICEAFSGKGQHRAAPTTAELSTVAKLTRMAGHFASEGAHRDRFLDILNDYLGGEGPLAVNKIGRFETDGTILVGDGEGMPIVILEVKGKVGESGDPGAQGQDYYRRYLLDRADKPGTAETVRNTPCPCLLLELMGPELRVSAMASTCDIQVVCEPLTTRLHLYDMFAANWEHMVAVAKVLRAIKFGAAELRQGYSSGASAVRPAKRPRPSTAPDAANDPQPLQRDPSLPLPYPLRPGSGCIVSAELPEPLLPPRQGCLLYRFWPAADAQSRLVKFVQRGSYGEVVHRAWAEQGLAPTLYSVRQLPGGLCMVQMEELQRGEGEAGWRSVAEIPAAERTEQLRAAVVGALQRAHVVDIGDGKRGVHGDARAANVLVRRTLPTARGSPPHMQEQQGAEHGGEGGHQRPSPSSQTGVDVARQQGPAATDIEVRFVDFDWAGIAGEAELPLWAVPRRALPDDRKLTTEYDLAVLDETWQLDFTTGVVHAASRS